MLSTLDILSNCRAELEIGAGWYEQEYFSHGQLDESISIIKAMWIDKYASVEGNYYKIKDAICNPKPIQKPHPLIMVGGSGQKYLLKVVAKYEDRYNLFFGSPDEMKKKKEYCGSFGRNYKEDIEYSVVSSCIIMESEEEVNRVLQNKTKEMIKVSKKEYSQYLAGGIMIGTPEKVL